MQPKQPCARVTACLPALQSLQGVSRVFHPFHKTALQQPWYQKTCTKVQHDLMVAHLLLVAMVQAQVCGQPAETYCIGGSHTRTAEGVRQLCAVLGTHCHLTDGVWPDNASAPSLFNRMRVPSQWRHTYSHKAVGTTAAHFDAWGVISAQGTSTSREWVVVLEGDAMLNPLLSRRSAGARRSSLQSGSSGARSRVLGKMQQHAETAERHSVASRLLRRAPLSSGLPRGAHGGFVHK